MGRLRLALAAPSACSGGVDSEWPDVDLSSGLVGDGLELVGCLLISGDGDVGRLVDGHARDSDRWPRRGNR